MIGDEALDDSQVRKDTVAKHSCEQEELLRPPGNFLLLVWNKSCDFPVQIIEAWRMPLRWMLI